MIGFNTHQANLFSLLIWDGSNFVCVYFFWANFCTVTTKKNGKLLKIQKISPNFQKHKISSRKKNPAQNVMLPRIIANVAVAASQASPDRSKTDFAIPFPVPVSPNI
jgi:hypothetical protein